MRAELLDTDAGEALPDGEGGERQGFRALHFNVERLALDVRAGISGMRDLIVVGRAARPARHLEREAAVRPDALEAVLRLLFR